MSKTVQLVVELTVADEVDPVTVADAMLDFLCDNDEEFYESCDGVEPVDV